jgi:hypothetical protein
MPNTTQIGAHPQPCFDAQPGQSSKVAEELPPLHEPLPLLSLVKRWMSMFPAPSAQPSLPLYLRLDEYHAGLPPTCYIPETLGRAVLREKIDALFNACEANESPELLEYWCEQEEGKGLTRPLKLDIGCWVFPQEVVARHVECMEGHMECLKGMLERKDSSEVGNGGEFV